MSNANDGLTTGFTVPETTDYVTVIVRYKNVSSGSLLFRVVSGANAALFADPLPPDEQEWRVAAITVAVDPSAAGLVLVALTADQSAAGGRSGSTRLGPWWEPPPRRPEPTPTGSRCCRSRSPW